MRVIIAAVLFIPLSSLAQTTATTTWTQADSVIQHQCEPGEHLELNGAGNRVVLRGDCGRLSVNGAGNRIRAERVAVVDITGADTEVVWSGRQEQPPKIRVVGAGSRVMKEKPRR